MISVRKGFVALAACLILVAGCANSTPFTYATDAGSFTTETLRSLIPELAKPGFMGRPVAEAPSMRHDALVVLRKQGDQQALLADLLTEQFSVDARAVPFWAATASVNGKDVWLVAEAWGLEGGELENIRVWAFDRQTGDVVASAVSK